MAPPPNCRQAVTSAGWERRLEDLHLEKIPDPRSRPHITHHLDAVLKLIIISIASNNGSAHGTQCRSRQLRPEAQESLGLPTPIAHNTISTLLSRISLYGLWDSLESSIKSEIRRRNLQHVPHLPCHVVAIDGKALISWPWHDLVRLTRTTWSTLRHANPCIIAPPYEEEGREPNIWEVYSLFSYCFHNVQIVCPSQGLPYGLLRAHRATLVSAPAAVGLFQEALLGSSNEVGTICQTVERLLLRYGATGLCELFVMDAGNTCLKVANLIKQRRRSYFLTLKRNQGEIFTQAVALLGDEARDVRPPDRETQETRGGRTVHYRVWRQSCPTGWGTWTHGRQLIRVERITVGDEEGEISIGNRYYITDRTEHELTLEQATCLSRMYWRCENEGHWAADAILSEDQTRGRLSRHPDGVVIASTLRMMAQNILAVLRVLSWQGSTRRRPTWREVMEYVLLVFCNTSWLDTERFDAAMED